MRDGEEVIDILARHPSTARFISTKLVRKFVSDDPPPDLVRHVSDVFMKTDGDIREMMTVIITFQGVQLAGNGRRKDEDSGRICGVGHPLAGRSRPTAVVRWRKPSDEWERRFTSASRRRVIRIAEIIG